MHCRGLKHGRGGAVASQSKLQKCCVYFIVCTCTRTVSEVMVTEVDRIWKFLKIRYGEALEVLLKLLRGGFYSTGMYVCTEYVVCAW